MASELIELLKQMTSDQLKNDEALFILCKAMIERIFEMEERITLLTSLVAIQGESISAMAKIHQIDATKGVH